MTAPLDHLFESLPGVWSVARAIEDDRMGKGRFGGQAVLTPQSKTALLYEEKGELVIGAWRGPAYRRWLYTRDAGMLIILYPDGQTPLHRFDFTANATRAHHTHLCGEDRYHAILAFSGSDRFTLDYAVDGPTKRFRLRTAYALKTKPEGTGARSKH